MDKKEIRDILLGRVIRLNETHWAAAPADAKFHFHGIKDGAGDVRLFGVSQLTRSFLAETDPASAVEIAEKCLNTMGRPLQLESAPDVKACLYAPNWIAPVVLTIEAEEEGLQLTAYTGRSLIMAGIRSRIAMLLFEKRLPEEITRAENKDRRKKDKTPTEEKVKEEKKPVPPKKQEKTPKKKAAHASKAPKRVAKKKAAGGKRLKK